MLFVSPLWLLALLPWAAVVIYCLLGQRPRQDVPFLELWQELHGPKPRHRRLAIPPAAIILGLLAVLFGILAAAGPAWLRNTPGAQHISLIIDRGLTMSARGQTQERYKELAGAAADAFRQRFGQRISARVLTVPSSGPPKEISFADLPQFLQSLDATARDTTAEMGRSVVEQLAEPDRLVLVVSDHELPVSSSRAIRIGPADPPANVGIARLAARQSPTTQVMVTVRNDSAIDSAILEVRSGDHRVERSLSLPVRGQSQNLFFEFPALDEMVGCRLTVSDELGADNAAVLARRRRWPRLETLGGASEAVLRMVDIYQKKRRPDADSRVVVIARDVATAGDRPAVLLGGAARDAAPADSATVHDHPVAADVRWDDLGSDVRVAGAPPAGFEPVVTRGDKTLLAVRPDPRQAWVGFDSVEFASRPQFVVFWTNVFNWVGEGGETFSSASVEEIEQTWRLVEPTAGAYASRMGPGIYEQLNGTVEAVSVGEVRLPRPAPSDWRQALDRIDLQQVTERRDLSLFALLAAMGLVVLSLAFWPTRQNQ